MEPYYGSIGQRYNNQLKSVRPFSGEKRTESTRQTVIYLTLVSDILRRRQTKVLFYVKYMEQSF